jgi:putative phosphoribosyl transferase
MFRDRSDAGIRLAERLGRYRVRTNALVLALPRGGVVTGYELARALNLRLDVLIVRKIGYPGQPELALGAVSETGTVVLNQSIVSSGVLSKEFIPTEIEQQKKEIAQRISLYRSGKRLDDLASKTVILVDDGVATGATMKAAIQTLKQEKLARLVVALPVGPPGTIDELKSLVDEIVCLDTPLPFIAVGNHYQDFSQVSDEEVVDLLKKAATPFGH